MEMEGGTAGVNPGDNGGFQKGGVARGVATAERPNLATIVGTEKEEGKSYSSMQDLKKKKEFIERMSKKRRQYVVNDVEVDTETEDEIAEIEKNGRAELEDIILADKKGVSKFLTQVGLKVGLLDPYKMIVRGKKDLESDIKQYARENARIKRELAKVEKELDRKNSDLEECYQNDDAIDEVIGVTDNEIKEASGKVNDGLKEGKDVTKERATMRRKQDYMRELEEQKLENAYMVQQLEAEVEASEDYQASLVAAREETLGKIYDLKGSLPKIQVAGKRTRVTLNTAKRDREVLEKRNKLAEMADIANSVAYEAEAVARANSLNMRYTGESRAESMTEARDRREEARLEAEKTKRDLFDHVRTSKQRHFEKYVS